MMLRISGTVENIVYRNDENGFCIAKIYPDDITLKKSVTIIGDIPDLHSGEYVTAKGKWEENKQYGDQFRIDDIIISNPSTMDNIKTFLPGILHGIGATYANKMIDKFGLKIFDIIENKSQLLESISGIGRKKRLRIKKSWDKHKVMREIFLYLGRFGVSVNLAMRIFKEYGSESLDIVKKNPYKIALDIRGIGFLTADQIATKLGVTLNSPVRIQAGILHILSQNSSEGNSCIEETTLIENTINLLSVGQGDIDSALLALLNLEKIALEKVGRENFYFLKNHWLYEKNISKKIFTLSSNFFDFPDDKIAKLIDWAQKKSKLTLTQNQIRAIEQVIKNPICVITGGPGVGKTTILKIIQLIFERLEKKQQFAAPTGRAAKRLSQSLSNEFEDISDDNYSKSNTKAKTIHRLLEVNPDGGFFKNEDNKLTGDIFVVDEASMIDLFLMSSFLDALPINKNVRLVIVGDIDQLPSVGAGAFLKDLIESDLVNVVKLKEIFRQASDSNIISIAHGINNGEVNESLFTGSNKDSNQTLDQDFFFIKKLEPEIISSTIIELIKNRIPKKFKFDPVSDIQVLTPMNRGPLGTVYLNEQLQNSLNPLKPSQSNKNDEVTFGSMKFRKGDKVIQTKNNYKKDIYNGDIGIISDIDTELLEISVTFENNRIVAYEEDELDEMKLAYAITIHKSQGSEFPVIIIPMSNQHFIMLQRNLLYTGITRGKKLVILVGDPKSYSIAVNRFQSKRRCTLLKYFLRSHLN